MQEIAIPNSNFLSASHLNGHYEGKVQILPSLDVIGLILKYYQHGLIVGNTGRGKGVLKSWLIDLAHDEYEMKIVSIYNPPPTIEDAFKKFPAEGRYAQILQSQGIEPEGQEVGVYLPVCKGFIPPEIPNFFHPYTVPLGGIYPSLDADLLSILPLEELTDIGKDAINHILQDFTTTDNLANFYYELDKLMEKGYKELKMSFKIVGKKTENPFHRVIFPLVKYRMMSDATSQYALTNKWFREILNDQEEISVFATIGPRSLRPFESVFVLQHVAENARFCRHPILVVASEIQDIMQSITYERSYPAIELMSKRMAELVAAGRKPDYHFLGDTQGVGSINPRFVKEALLISAYTDLGDDRDYHTFVRKLKSRERAKDLINILHGLKCEPSEGIFEYYIPSLDETFYTRLPYTATPYQGNKSDFIQYLKYEGEWLLYSSDNIKSIKFCKKRYQGKWELTEPIFEEIEQAILERVDQLGLGEYIEQRDGSVEKEFREMAKEKKQSKDDTKSKIPKQDKRFESYSC